MKSLSRSGRILPGLLILGVLLLLAVLTAGCTQQPATPPVTTSLTTQAPSGIANPASVYCRQVGGTTDIKKDASGGEYGMCTFNNGTSCEEWALFRGEGCKAGVSAADGKKMVTFTEADNGKTSDIAQGTSFSVQLKENPTTGFQWNVTYSPGLSLVSDDYQVNPHAEGMVGVGGTHTWIFLAKDTGVQKFTGIYRRSWEPVTGNETAVVVNVNVVKI